MRRICGLVAVVVLAGACSKHNPDACCTNADQCLTLGLDQVYLCTPGDYCDSNGNCLSGCATSADCGGNTPACKDHVCAAGCASNNDCVSTPEEPYCEADGTCGACLSNANCPVSAPICDATTYACHGCASGADCVSDVCNIDGTCADTALFAYISSQGNDAGTCTQAAPCNTLGFAGTVLGTRTRVHILGTSYSSGASSIVVPANVAFIDSNNAVVTNDGSQVVFTLGAGGGPTAHVTLQGITIGTSGRTLAGVMVANMSTATFQHVQLLQPFVVNAQTSLVVEDSTLAGTATNTSSGATTVRRSKLQIGIATTNGTLTYQRNLFDHPTARALEIGGNPGTTATIENSIFVSNGASSSVIDLTATGVTIRFVTIVDLQATSTPPVTCPTSGTQIDSSIVAWNNIVLPNCQVSYSLFNGSSSQGGSNLAADVSTFFLDLAGKDFHLTATSPALHASNPSSTISEDLAGGARPNPASSVRDVGALESPD